MDQPYTCILPATNFEHEISLDPVQSHDDFPHSSDTATESQTENTPESSKVTHGAGSGHTVITQGLVYEGGHEGSQGYQSLMTQENAYGINHIWEPGSNPHTEEHTAGYDGRRGDYQVSEYTPSSGETEPGFAHPDTGPTSSTEKPKSFRLLCSLWAWEIGASAFSIACMASVVGILSYEQGKPLDQWRQVFGTRVSPTALVSFLGTIGKSACLVAVAEIISQLKWMHFEEPQKLSDLQLFDSASRGPGGALKLAFLKHHKALLALCASVITIAALFIDPLIQLTFDFPARLTPSNGERPATTILASQVYDPLFLEPRFMRCYGPAKIDSVMQAAILSPLWNVVRDPDLSCSFERCEWPTITTLGVCSSCFDLTSTVISDCSLGRGELPRIECNYTLPTVGTSFEAVFSTTGGAALMLPYQPLLSSTAKQLPDPAASQPARIGQFSFVKFAENIPWQTYINFSSDHRNQTLATSPHVEQAMQCSFDLCAKTFTTPYYENSSAGPMNGPETLLKIVDDIPLDSGGRLYLDLEPISSDHTLMDRSFMINFCNYQDLADYMKDLFTLEWSSEGMSRVKDGRTNTTRFGRQPVTPNIGLALSQTDDISSLMQSIADSMTEVFRTSANSTAYAGIGLNTVTFISITWAWLTLPIALVLMTFAMLIIVIARNHGRRIPAWKSSSLALLFHDLKGWEKSELELLDVRAPRALERKAAAITAYARDKSGVFSFQRTNPSSD